MKYTTIQDVINYEIYPALGDFKDEYSDNDLMEIANRTYKYVDGSFVEIGNADDFWKTIEDFDAEMDEKEEQMEIRFTIDVKVRRRDSRNYAVSTTHYKIGRYIDGSLFLCSPNSGSADDFKISELLKTTEETEQLIRNELTMWTNP